MRFDEVAAAVKRHDLVAARYLVNNAPMSQSPYAFDIRVQPRYLDEQSQPAANRFVFSYTVRITNTGSVPARLIARHWVITDGHGKIEEVRGPGVVGEQPHMAPGESFEYTSGAVLTTAVGTMHGSYSMLADDGSKFEATIPRFTLAIPRTLH
jgi:ApaG protein